MSEPAQAPTTAATRPLYHVAGGEAVDRADEVTPQTTRSQDVVRANPPDPNVTHDRALAGGPQAVEQKALATQIGANDPAVQGRRPAAERPADSDHSYAEFDEIPLPGLEELQTPDRGSSKRELSENPGVAEFIEQLLRTASRKGLINRDAPNDREKFLPRTMHRNLRNLGHYTPREIQDQYRALIDKGFGKYKQSPDKIGLMRRRWLQGMRNLYRFIELSAGRDDRRYNYIYTSQDYVWHKLTEQQQKARRVPLKDKPYLVKEYPPVEPIVVEVLDRTWALATGGADKLQFRANNREGDAMDQHGSGFCADLYLGTHDTADGFDPETGFWRPEPVARLINCVKQAAAECEATFQAYYNDVSVYRLVNTDAIYVKPKMQAMSNWHGPAPFTLHVHLDIVPL
jgi:hypothetical protein